MTSKRNRVVVGSDVHQGARKTGKGLRITIDPMTVAALKAHRKRQLAEQLAWGEAWQDGDYVFASEDGSPMHPQTIARHLRSLADAAGVPRIGVHGMRHSCATLALDAGVPLEIVSDRPDHSSIAITADIYTHGSDRATGRRAARIMGGLG